MLVYPEGNVEAYDSDDELMSSATVTKFRKVIGF
jgi:hypothetical protein